MSRPRSIQWSADDIAKMRRWYERDQSSVRDIARYFECSRGAISRTLKAAGVVIREREAQKRQEMVSRGTLQEVVEEAVTVNELTDCWCVRLNRGGARPRIWFRGVPYSPLLASWLAFRQQRIPKGHCLWLACRNPACIAPEHLRAGTRGQYSRFIHPQDSVVATLRRLSNPRRRSLTDEQAARARAARTSDEITALAQETGVSRQTILRIRLGTMYRTRESVLLEAA